MALSETTGIVSFVASSEIIYGRRVKISASGQPENITRIDPLLVEHCGSSDRGIGVALADASAGQILACQLDSQGVHPCVVSGSVTGGDELFAAADGRVSASGTVPVATATETCDNNDSSACVPLFF